VTVNRDYPYPAHDPPVNLSAVLAATQSDLTEYVRARTDSSAALLAIMASGDADAQTASAPIPPARTATKIRLAASTVRSLAAAPRRLIARRTAKRALGIAAWWALGLVIGAALVAGIVAGVEAGGIALIEVIAFAFAAGVSFIVIATVMVIIGIHQEVRRMTVLDGDRPPTACALLARRVLGSHFYLTSREPPRLDNGGEDAPWLVRPLRPESRRDRRAAPR
jgi:hypothetical protein